jgi:hypothetical protein
MVKGVRNWGWPGIGVDLGSNRGSPNCFSTYVPQENYQRVLDAAEFHDERLDLL